MTNTPPEAAALDLEREWQALLDKDDRTSPEEYPDMVLITREEVGALLAARQPAEPQGSRAGGAPDAELRAMKDIVFTLKDYALDMKNGYLVGKDGKSFVDIGTEDAERCDAMLATLASRPDQEARRAGNIEKAAQAFLDAQAKVEWDYESAYRFLFKDDDDGTIQALAAALERP